MTRYEAALSILDHAFDSVRRGEDGPFLAINTLAALGIKEEES